MKSSLTPLSCNVGPVERVLSAAVGAALLAAGMRRRSATGAATAFLGGAFLLRGAAGICPVKAALAQGEPGAGQAESAVLEHGEGIDVEQSVTVLRSADELYAFWRKLENLPLFMEKLHSVTAIDEVHSLWVAEGPAGQRVEWKAEIINDEPNERIGWRSLPGSDVTHAGSVQFLEAPGGKGTEVRVHMRWDPPMGRAGALVAKLFRRDPEREIAEELRRFKQLMEAGEAPTVEGQPSGR
jgi:uncharacterized membrane protein